MTDRTPVRTLLSVLLAGSLALCTTASANALAGTEVVIRNMGYLNCVSRAALYDAMDAAAELAMPEMFAGDWSCQANSSGSYDLIHTRS